LPLVNTAASLVTVCVTPSLFVHVTVVFTDTVRVCGLNAIPCIVTAFPDCVGPAVNVTSFPYAVPALLLAYARTK